MNKTNLPKDTQKCRKCLTQRDKALYIPNGRTCKICRDKTDKECRLRAELKRKQGVVDKSTQPRCCNRCFIEKEHTEFQKSGSGLTNTCRGCLIDARKKPKLDKWPTNMDFSK